MSIVKRGSYGSYGYSSKPQMNYHQQNSEYVTTVIKEMSRMTVSNNQKPVCGYGVGDVKKEVVCKEKAVEENNCRSYNNGSISSYHGGDAVKKQQHEYKHEAAFEEKKGGYNGYKHESAFEETKASSYQHGGGGAVQKQHEYNHKDGGDYNKHEAAYEEKKHDSGYNYNCYQQHGGGAVKQKQEVFVEANKADNYSGYHHGGGGAAKQQKHEYHHPGGGVV